MLNRLFVKNSYCQEIHLCLKLQQFCLVFLVLTYGAQKGFYVFFLQTSLNFRVNGIVCLSYHKNLQPSIRILIFSPSTSKATLWCHFYLLLLKETEVQSPGFEEYVSSQSVHFELRWWRQHHQKSAAAAKRSENVRSLVMSDACISTGRQVSAS